MYIGGEGERPPSPPPHTPENKVPYQWPCRSCHTYSFHSGPAAVLVPFPLPLPLQLYSIWFIFCGLLFTAGSYIRAVHICACARVTRTMSEASHSLHGGLVQARGRGGVATLAAISTFLSLYQPWHVDCAERTTPLMSVKLLSFVIAAFLDANMIVRMLCIKVYNAY
jgi:hypothetical protein